MTKLRAPLTFENALTRVAGLIGWGDCATIVGKAERTVRYWSDTDASACITLDAALKLDIAFRAAGGEGAPMFQCYALRLDAEARASEASFEALLKSIARSAKEHGEALSAAIAASRPGAGLAAIAIAERELEETIDANTNMLANLRAVRGTGMSTLGGKPEDVE